MMANHGIPVDSHSSHIRKSNKPLLEKKRRARINRSLDQLKSLVLEALKKDTARYSKLEKADILEMTVRHLREVQRQEMTVAMSLDPTVTGKYRTGFAECAQEVNRYLGTIDGLSAEVRMRLMQHLTGCVGSFGQMIAQLQMAGHVFPFASPAATPIGILPGQAGMYPEEAAFTGLPSADVFCRNAIEPHGMTPDEIPSRQNSPVENMTFTYDKKDNLTLTWPHGQSNMPLCENNGRTVKRESAESMESKRYFKTNSESINHRVSHPGQVMDVKSEPVWRPW